MIDRHDKHCSGCFACEQICPKKAISIYEDERGLPYPNIDFDKCVECNLCEQVCQCKKSVVNQKQIMEFFAARNNNLDVLSKSQSGGLASALAECVIESGGSCFGAAINTDTMKVEQIRITIPSDIRRIQGSKYVESMPRDTFQEVEEDLKTGMTVLYTGTSCMVDGLIRYLKAKNVDTGKLITCDLICHGVMSPRLYLENIKRIETDFGKKVIAYNFRNKEKVGWRDLLETIYFSDGSEIDENVYSDLYYSNVANRNSCYECQYLQLDCKKSDITMADFWGIEKSHIASLDDNKGWSLAIVHTEKGRELLSKADLQIHQLSENEATGSNLNTVPSIPKYYIGFWGTYKRYGFLKCLKLYTNYGGTWFKIKRRLLKMVGYF